MIRGLIGFGMASVAVLGVAGCFPAASGPLPKLSSTDRSANASIIAELVDRLCVANATKPDAFPELLRQTGWAHRQTQRSGRDTTLNVWKLPHIELVYAGTPIDAPSARVWTCMVAVDATAAPSTAELDNALRPRTDRRIFDSHPANWRWKPSPLTEAHITIDATMTGGQSVFVEFADIKPFNVLFGS